MVGDAVVMVVLDVGEEEGLSPTASDDGGWMLIVWSVVVAMCGRVVRKSKDS